MAVVCSPEVPDEKALQSESAGGSSRTPSQFVSSQSLTDSQISLKTMVWKGESPPNGTINVYDTLNGNCLAVSYTITV